MVQNSSVNILYSMNIRSGNNPIIHSKHRSLQSLSYHHVGLRGRTLSICSLKTVRAVLLNTFNMSRVARQLKLSDKSYNAPYQLSKGVNLSRFSTIHVYFINVKYLLRKPFLLESNTRLSCEDVPQDWFIYDRKRGSGSSSSSSATTSPKVWLQHRHLRITSSFVLLPFLYFIIHSNKNTSEYILGLLTLITFIFSQIFWKNPVKNSKIHRYDASIAKLTIISHFLYTSICKQLCTKIKVLYCVILLCIILVFYCSNKYSKQKWCCKKHVVYHGLLHLICSGAGFFAFL